jgi:hypothetical protein
MNRLIPSLERVILRVIEINTPLLPSQEGNQIVASPLLRGDARGMLVYAYFRRWPCQETQFKIQKSVVSINRVAGYFKTKVDDINVIEKLSQLEN